MCLKFNLDQIPLERYFLAFSNKRPFARDFLHQYLFCFVFLEHCLPSGPMCRRLFKNILYIIFSPSFSLSKFKQLHSMFKTCQVATLSTLAGRSSPCHTPDSALGSDISKFLNNIITFLTPPGALIAVQTSPISNNFFRSH